MKFYQTCYFILLILFISGTLIFYVSRNNAQQKLNEQVALSLELNEQALQLYADSEYELARENLQKSLQLNKLNPNTFVYSAFVDTELGSCQESYESFSSALNMEATSVDMIKHISNLLIKGGYPDLAIGYLHHGLNDFPGDKTLLILLGKAQLLSGKYDESIQTFQLIPDDDHGIYKVDKYLGFNYYFLGKKDTAKEYFINYLSSKNTIENTDEISVEELTEKVMDMWGTNNG